MWSSTATGSLLVPVFPPSSSVMAPVAGPPTTTPAEASDTLRLTVNVSSLSTTASSTVSTVRACRSPAVPVKRNGEVFGV